ncbi:MAG: tetratricopeptide repeat protein [Rhodospirillales bacterium]|nr:tetratricopeptide repeat protein [Rhodospirillales bacterium]
MTGTVPQADTALLAQGERLLARGHAEAALAAFRAARGPLAEDGLARAWLALDDAARALAHADAAVAALPIAAIHANRATVLLRLDRLDAAREAADKALALHPSQPRARAVVAAIDGVPWAPAAEKPALPPGAEAMLAQQGGALLVGVAWRSDRARDPVLDDPPGTPGAARVDVPLSLCLRFLALYGARLVLLRRGPPDPATMRLATLGIVVDPCGPLGLDEAQLAGLIARLHLVVSVDGRAAELAGLLGRPGLVLLPSGMAARWPENADGPERRSVRAIRQQKPGEWEPVLHQAAQAVMALLKQRPAEIRKAAGPAEAAQAQAAMAEGHRRHAAGDANGAALLWSRALLLDPGQAAAWANLGVMMRTIDDPAAAIACYRQAIGIGGVNPGTLGNLANALKDLDLLPEAIAAHEQVLAMEPGKPSHHHNYGIALRQAGRYRDAIAAFERTLAISPGLKTVCWDLALARLQVGDFAQGWPLYESRWDLGDISLPALAAPLWRGEDLSGKTILLHSEQGFGDAIQCVRYAGALKARGAARVVLDCKPPLERLFATVPGVDAIAPRGQALPPHDVHCPLNSLPGLFGTDTTNIPGAIPFLRAPEDGAGKFATALALAGTRLKLGIVWSGSVTFKDNHHRATTLARFLRHFALPEVCLFSLQKGPPEAELRALGPDAPLVDLAPLIDDFADTAAVIGQLDLVLMTDSSVAHLAGALGAPVWVLLPHHAHWLWLENDRDATPWYPSMRFFRQARANDWDAPFAAAGEALASLARSR